MKNRLLDYYTNKVRARVLIYKNSRFILGIYDHMYVNPANFNFSTNTVINSKLDDHDSLCVRCLFT